MGCFSARAQRSAHGQRPPGPHWEAPPPPGVRLARARLAPPITYGRARRSAHLRAPHITYGRAHPIAYAPPITYRADPRYGDVGAGAWYARRRPYRRGPPRRQTHGHCRDVTVRQRQRPRARADADDADDADDAPAALFQADGADNQGELAPAGSDATVDAAPRADTCAPRADTSTRRADTTADAPTV